MTELKISFMQEINDALFSEKEAKIKELQQEKERLEAEIERKKEILREKSKMNSIVTLEYNVDWAE